jgi:amyloid beta precursor protein binding protein 1
LQDDYVSELVRFGAGELHVLGAIVGGMAAQEAIKLITGQFVPFNGALVYNAVNSTTSVLEF